MKFNERFKDAPWMDKEKTETIVVGGVGGIGSTTLYFLTKSTLANFIIFDNDVVDEYNVGTQFFMPSYVNTPKVGAIKDILKTFGVNSSRIQTINSKIGDTTLPITIAAFDNMAARKQLFNAWKSLPDREIFIDGRLSATIYQVYTVIPGREELYEKTLFDDNDVANAPCTFKQTTHFAGLIGARITQLITNYLSNKYAGENIMNIPYLVEEYGDPFLVKIQYENI